MRTVRDTSACCRRRRRRRRRRRLPIGRAFLILLFEFFSTDSSHARTSSARDTKAADYRKPLRSPRAGFFFSVSPLVSGIENCRAQGRGSLVVSNSHQPLRASRSCRPIVLVTSSRARQLLDCSLGAAGDGDPYATRRELGFFAFSAWAPLPPLSSVRRVRARVSRLYVPLAFLLSPLWVPWLLSQRK